MFLAKFQNNMVLASNKGYLILPNFSWTSFKWPESLTHVEYYSKNFSTNLVEFPVNPSKIICVGRNYVEHAKELGNIVPKEPLLFFKPNNSLLGPHGRIQIPKMSQKVDYELELVVVIGKKGKSISLKDAMNYVLGYTIGLDITARDLQKKDKTWFRGKGFDTFAPVGPWIAPPLAINLTNCEFKLFINDEERQIGNTKDMIFKIPYLIEYISQIVTFEPGDLIFTGTPKGVGQIHSGDKLKAIVDGIGNLIVNVS
ncbi:MAG: fumarylacetoacetate hydrolase family protein [Candidatus Hodarchaeales archaeon]|jgi:2-keto-4-pentenoate hydratase/2-oxohepta-3-ene-1,7-dioic acid hydratase in catechol pathway